MGEQSSDGGGDVERNCRFQIGDCKLQKGGGDWERGRGGEVGVIGEAVHSVGPGVVFGPGGLRFGGIEGAGGGVGGEGFDRAGEDAEASQGGDDAGLLAEVFGVVRGVPEDPQVCELIAELVGGQVLGEAGFLLLLQFGFDGQSRGEPVADALDDLADAGLGNAVFLGDGSGGSELDQVHFVDVEVAGGGREGRGHGGLLGNGILDFRFWISDSEISQECRGRDGLVWSISVKEKKDFLKLGKAVREQEVTEKTEGSEQKETKERRGARKGDEGELAADKRG